MRIAAHVIGWIGALATLILQPIVIVIIHLCIVLRALQIK